MPYHIIGDRELYETMQHVAANKLPVSLHFDLIAFARMLAKIAHGFAVAEIGLHDIDPMLPDLMFNRDIRLASYLIGAATINLPANEDILHQVGWAPLRWGNQWLAGVRIRLFAGHPSTQAAVVIAGVPSQRAVSRYRLGQ